MKGAVKDFSKLLSGNLLARAFGFAATMLFARVLTKEQLAIFPVYLMLNGIAVILLDCGITPLFSRLLPSLFREDVETARSLLWTGLAFVVAGALLVSASTALFASQIAGFVFKDTAQADVVAMLAPGFIAYAVTTGTSYVMVARAQFISASVIQVVESVVRPLLTVALFLALGVRGIVMALVAAQIIIAALSVYCVRDALFGRWPRVYSLRLLFSQSLPLYFDSYLFYLRGEGDNWLVSAFLGPQTLAAYYIAKTLFSAAVMILQSLDKVVVERFARHRNAAEEFDSRVQNLHAMTSQIVLPILLLAVALTPYLIVLLGGARYRDAAAPAVLLMMVALVQFLILPIDRAVFVALSPLYRLSKTALETVVVFASAMVLAPLASASGIAAARLLGEAAGGGYGWFLLGRRRGLKLALNGLWLSLLTASPGTILILLLAPRTASSVHAAIMIPALAAGWLAAFLILSYRFNRDQFERWISITHLAGNSLPRLLRS